MSTWDEIVAVAPVLRSLEAIARRAGATARGEYTAWSREVKPLLLTSVGEYAGDPRLATSQAYDTAYAHLLRVYEEQL